MKFIATILASVLLSLSSAVFAADPITNLINTPVPANIDGTSPKLDAIKAAIISACRARGWTSVIGQSEILSLHLY